MYIHTSERRSPPPRTLHLDSWKLETFFSRKSSITSNVTKCFFLFLLHLSTYLCLNTYMHATSSPLTCNCDFSTWFKWMTVIKMWNHFFVFVQVFAGVHFLGRPLLRRVGFILNPIKLKCLTPYGKYKEHWIFQVIFRHLHDQLIELSINFDSTVIIAKWVDLHVHIL
jgi:hypothetical protein